MKYLQLIGWIDAIDKEFTVKKAKTENGMARSSCENILALLHKVGLLDCKVCNTFGAKTYNKTELWNKEKAIKANNQRLKAKWQRYKPRK